jgi:uncharacterized surface protein with fasciclin (FAS1) repeats
MKFFKHIALLASFVSFASAQAGQMNRSTSNIVEIAVGNGSFKTLVAAVQAAGLVATLSAPGALTVFAPTDAAFAKLPAGTVEALLKDTAQLTKILTYHVLGAEKSPRALLNEKMVITLQGKAVAVSFDGRTFKINDSKVVMNPIYASNGVIYVIDTVLLP